MCESVKAAVTGASTPVEVALGALSADRRQRLVVGRPRGSWVVVAMHGSGAVTPDSLGRVARARSLSGPAGVVEPAVGDPRVRLLEEGAELLDAVVDVERRSAQLAGARVRALASFARCRPSVWDRQPGERGAASAASRAARPAVLTEVSEWAADEVAVRLRISGRAASELLVESVELVEQLPGTLAALEAGDISWAQARALTELLRPVTAGKKAAVEARVLPRAGRQTVAQLRECTRRAIARIDADAALRRLETAIRGRKVTRQAGEDGMAVLTA
ncbi:DUF222 domain-containing protein, partial [Blastococcus sp. TF02A-26]|uniref:DUF222 domain-containing protein n=1 Tax=Blastococcus sp. TF02A-26 TaxID=2250577 RepID=UPI000DE9183F